MKPRSACEAGISKQHALPDRSKVQHTRTPLTGLNFGSFTSRRLSDQACLADSAASLVGKATQ